MSHQSGDHGAESHGHPTLPLPWIVDSVHDLFNPVSTLSTIGCTLHLGNNPILSVNVMKQGGSDHEQTDRLANTAGKTARLHLGKDCLLVGCLTSKQHVSVSQGRICEDNFTCCYTETEVADQTLHLAQSQYPDRGPTSSSTDPITPDAWQGSHWSANF